MVMKLALMLLMLSRIRDVVDKSLFELKVATCLRADPFPPETPKFKHHDSARLRGECFWAIR